MPKYAAQTEVSSQRSREEIERILQRYGATGFAYATDWEEHRAMIEFRARGLRIRMIVPLPRREEFDRTPTGIWRSEETAQRSYEQGTRQRWRALVLCVKAKLEAVDSGIETFEEAFLAHIVLPGENVRAGQWLLPQIARAYERNEMPPMLPEPRAKPILLPARLDEGEGGAG